MFQLFFLLPICREVSFELSHRFSAVIEIDSIVPLEHRHRLVAGHGHDDTRMDARLSQIRDGRVSVIMKAKPLNPCPLASVLKSPSEFSEEVTVFGGK